MSQSTNDSYPTAIKVAYPAQRQAGRGAREACRLVPSKGNEYLESSKMGRTELQDAVPMTVGQEFHAFAASLEREIQLLKDAESISTPRTWARPRSAPASTCPRLSEKVRSELAKLTGKPIVPADDMIAATWDQQGFVVYSRRSRALRSSSRRSRAI
jgi:aspartate ammonia-lyase